jgi:hypothetical protein
VDEKKGLFSMRAFRFSLFNPKARNFGQHGGIGKDKLWIDIHESPALIKTASTDIGGGKVNRLENRPVWPIKAAENREAVAGFRNWRPAINVL